MGLPHALQVLAAAGSGDRAGPADREAIPGEVPEEAVRCAAAAGVAGAEDADLGSPAGRAWRAPGAPSTSGSVVLHPG